MPRTLGRLVKNRGAQGEPLPGVFSRLDNINARLRRGQVSLVAGAPGGGKSALAMHFATRMRYPTGQGVPTLYWSADTDLATLGIRATASLQNKPISEIESLIETGDDSVISYLDRELSHIWWTDESGPSLEDIDKEVDAYAHVSGEYPHYIVIDNLMDVYGDSDDEGQSFKNTMAFCNELSRRTAAHVQVLCHVKGKYENGRTAIGLDGPLQNITKKPRLVLTLFHPQPGIMGFRVVKNTMGPASPDGSFGIDVGWLGERQWFGG